MADSLTLTITFLGGGIIGALIRHASTARSEKQRRQSTYVHEQLDRLYGPLFFLSGQNEALFELNHDILKAHSEYFGGREWSQDRQTQETLNEESSQTFELSRTYYGQVIENNEAIVSVLRDNYSLVDVDDVELFNGFTIDALRMNKEINEERSKKIPIIIRRAIGNISYSRPEFLARVKQRFTEKQNLLKEYQ